MVEIKGKSISITRGDSVEFNITLGGDVPSDETLAIFTVGERVGCHCGNEQNVPVIEKVLNISQGLVTIPITGADTNIPVGTYEWDLRLKYEDGSYWTPMKPAPFEILPSVGRNGVDEYE